MASVSATAGAPSPSEAEAEQAVIAAIPAWHGQRATIVRYLDLTQPFATRSPWVLVVAHDPRPKSDSIHGELTPVSICLVHGAVPHCTGTQMCDVPARYRRAVAIAVRTFAEPGCSGDPIYDVAAADVHAVLEARVVYTAAGDTRPLLLLKTGNLPSGNGSREIQTVLYRYARARETLEAVFVNSMGSNENEAAHFIGHGPLRGDEIVDYPTEHAPYVYWVEVYARHGDAPYRRILRYRSVTRYGDGNPLPVAASERVEILRRLGLWKPGEPMPTPADAPATCAPLVMRHGELWCRTARLPSPSQ